MDVGNQIGERRRALGLSQEELAQRLYVSRVTVSNRGTSKTLPDVQSMLLLANLFGTTIDELVRGDVDEMREMVEKGEQQRKAFAIALGAVEVTVIAVLAFMATAGRGYLDSALRLLLAVLVLASSVVTLVARRGGGNREAKSAAELLGAASGDPVEAARESASANAMRLVLQVFVGLTVGIGVLVIGGLLLDVQDFTGLAAAVGGAAALAAAQMLGRYTRSMWTAAVLPALWVAGVVILSATTGSPVTLRRWIAVVGVAILFLAFWVIGRGKRRG
ncbi:helix-turn-helix domain-containing protein [Collinsella tanakaei]|uniref:helix-turn-helix domain-containing protein n=1 Tax=Collinsella tanakaei TaxID=626935 RepID=UPI0025A391BD|nr:helix-turn-helix transcriptional regulator [Collinsella tanakaei]MDM8301517.1 helix-turn-helix transcriptional regulator [Collinsella tanakaei]